LEIILCMLRCKLVEPVKATGGVLPDSRRGRGVVGWESVGTAFPHLFLAWERVPTPFCTSNVA